jgi:hypothetical protein
VRVELTFVYVWASFIHQGKDMQSGVSGKRLLISPTLTAVQSRGLVHPLPVSGASTVDGDKYSCSPGPKK